MAFGAGEPPDLIGRLSPDRDLARHAAFALFAQVYLEQSGLVPRRLAPASRDVRQAPPPVDALPEVVAGIYARNPFLVAYFADPARRAALGTLDAGATRELLGWVRAQHVELEAPQIAYELGMLALGVELPAILVGTLRDAPVQADTRVIELPDGAGYAVVFLATLHPEWRAAERARLFVESADAAQLAAWAMVLLARRVEPPAGSIVRVSRDHRAPLDEATCDVALVYNPVPWLANPETSRAAARAACVVVL